MVCWVVEGYRLFMAIWEADKHVVGSDRNETTSMAMIVMVSREMIILPEIPLGRRTSPRRRRANVVERILTLRTLSELYREEAIRNKQSTHENTTTYAWHDSQTIMMHVRFKYARHDEAHNKYYTLSEAQYATSCILTKLHAWIT